MSLNEEVSETIYVGEERRSSVRARVRAPLSIERVSKEQIPEIESMILDQAVLDAEYASLGASDWVERADDLHREVVFLLKEIRAMRQQMTDIQRLVAEMQSPVDTPHWVVINERGLWLENDGKTPELEPGEFVRVTMQIASIVVPKVFALGEVIRVKPHPRIGGVAVAFRAISEIHGKAILQYALQRERALARSKLFSSLKI
ncbi:MAG: hypothetical protein AAGI01_15435 [Myxococcota bacterium]